MNENWPRWIFASFSKAFSTSLTTSGLTVFIEGTDRDTDALGEDHIEFRMDGPRVTQLPGNEYKVWIAVNILFKHSMGTDFHAPHRMAGQILAAFTDTVTVFKLGTGIDDDQSQFGCFALDKRRENGVQVNHFGQIDPIIRVEQGTVEGHYIAYLTDNT